jgi:hypothetical protein
MSSSPDNASVPLRLVLSRLGLSNYYDRLIANGFDSWKTVLDITEKDLGHLSFKLGHRRKLQREIANHRHRRTLNEVDNHNNTNSGSTLARVGNTRDSADRDFSITAVKSEKYLGLTQPAERKLQGCEANKEIHNDGSAHLLTRSKLNPLDDSNTNAGRTTPPYDAILGQAEQLRHNNDAVDLAMSEVLHLLKANTSDVKMFDSTHLPPYEATALAITAFLQGPGARLFLWTREEASSTISAVYNSHSQMDPYVLVDLLAMAAVGTLCGCNCFTEALGSSYYFSCLQLLSACTEARNLSCMRVFSCLSYCCVLRHPSSASQLNGKLSALAMILS